MKLPVYMLLSMAALVGCSDPDIVPETHISTPPPAQASGTPAERFPLKTADPGDQRLD